MLKQNEQEKKNERKNNRHSSENGFDIQQKKKKNELKISF